MLAALTLLEPITVEAVVAACSIAQSLGTRGSGHFNAAQGAVGMVHACGGILSQLLGSVIVAGRIQYSLSVLAVIAGLGGALFWLGMPESRNYAGQRAPAERNT
jgi:hypothetical protein